MVIQMDDDLKDNRELNKLKVEIETALNDCDKLKGPQKNIFKTILEVLNYILGENEANVSEVKNSDINNANLPTFVEKLCKFTGISLEDLEYVFSFKDESFELNTINGDTEEEKQFNATLCILTANNFCYGKKEINSKELKKQVENLGIESLGNLSTNLKKKKYKKYLNVKGKPRAPKIYTITTLGIKKGKKLIKDIIKQEKGELNE